MESVTVEEIKEALGQYPGTKAKVLEQGADGSDINEGDWSIGSFWSVWRKVKLDGRFAASIEFEAWSDIRKSGHDSVEIKIEFDNETAGTEEDARQIIELLAEDAEMLEVIALQLCR